MNTPRVQDGRVLLTIPRTLLAIACGALVALSACSDSDSPTSSSPGSDSAAGADVTTIPGSVPVETAPIETDVIETNPPLPAVDIEIGAADTSVVGGFDIDGAPASLISRRFQITNNSPAALQGSLTLSVGCPDENVLGTTAPAPADELAGLEISPGDPVSIEVGASAQLFAEPILVPDVLPLCADSTSPALLLNVTDLLTGDPLPSVTGPLMVVEGGTPQTFVVMEAAAQAIAG
jgi:hypothetical protein